MADAISSYSLLRLHHIIAAVNVNTHSNNVVFVDLHFLYWTKEVLLISGVAIMAKIVVFCVLFW